MPFKKEKCKRQEQGRFLKMALYRRRQMGKGRTKKPVVHGIKRLPCLLPIADQISAVFIAQK